MTVEVERRAIPAVTGILLLIVGLGVGCRQRPPTDPVHASGRVEADEVRIAAKITGRIDELSVDEGDRVEKGQTLARLAIPELEAQLRQAEAAVAAARTSVAQAQARAEVLEHHSGSARADVERLRALRDSGAATTRQLEEADDRLAEVLGELRVARAREEQARATLAERQAAEDVVRVNLDEREIVSPLDGVVLHRLAEPGEVMQAGQPLAVLIDPDRLDLKVYVPEDEVAKVRVGDRVRAVVDAFPDRVFGGEVIEIAEKAEFTPRDVHVPEERTRLVYAVRVRMQNQDGYLKPGMIADAEVLWNEASEGGTNPR